ncbi:hypothetical protein O6H91_11G081000 [Diphasiastrum complanatum]|nr:hypothetical protein O6H91_11G081000 [Diphasiastrum complanatum]KAJ7539200.1 hypothetical protein O6H91_11G081000 [Diphasiastrum complanatum]
MAPGKTQRSVFYWTTELTRQVKDGQDMKALKLFQDMQNEGVNPDKYIFVPVLKACARLMALEEGRYVHGQIIQQKCQSDVFVSSCLIDMYAKCRSIEDVNRVFNGMFTCDVVVWSSMISAYAICDKGEKALELYKQMKQENVVPNHVTILGVLKACTSIDALEEGRFVHAEVIRRGLDSNVSIANCLMDMYAKCGSIEDACSVFNVIQTPDVISWSAMILGYANCGMGKKGLVLFQQMQREKVEPNSASFVGTLKACSSIVALEEGRHVHGQAVLKSQDTNVLVASCLINLYAKSGSIEDACQVFSVMPSPNSVSWSAMVVGYVSCGQGLKALQLFRQMLLEGIEMDKVTFVNILNACASVRALEDGRHVHTQAVRSGLDSDICVGNCLIDMYAKCGSIEDACRVFANMPTHNLVSWSSMILGFANCGQGVKALELFQLMLQDGMEPNIVTYVGVLKACTDIAALKEGRHIHAQVIKRGFESEVIVTSCLVDMYARCGNIEDAYRVFNNSLIHDMALYNSMIGGYAVHGLGKGAFEIFERMSHTNLEMDDATFVGLLSAFSHAGMIDEALYYLESMSPIYDGVATVEHHSCLVDLLGRSGYLDEAKDMINKMPCSTDTFVWTAFLSACRKYNNLQVGEWAAKHVLNLDPTNSAAYVLLSNIYATVGKFSNSEDLQQMWGSTGIDVNK